MREKLKSCGYHVVMMALALLWLIPLLWTLVISLSSNSSLKTNSQILMPTEPTLSNYADVFRTGLAGRWFLNSMSVSIVPKEAMFVPLFMMFSEAGLANSYIALIFPRVAFPLGVFIMTQFFSQVPSEMEEAAQVDGASPVRIFFSIMVPLARPALIALATFSFVQTWNDYLWPLVSATKPEMFTVTTGLASLQGTFAQSTELGSLMARGIVGAAPLLIVFLLLQKYLIRGISLSSGDK